MKTAIKSTLKRLSNGPRTEKELTHAVANQGAIIRNLYDAQNGGFCIGIGEHWHLTNLGRAALEAKKEPRSKEGRICAGTANGIYAGSDLRRVANRPGCYNFLDVPSLMHYGRIYRKDANV